MIKAWIMFLVTFIKTTTTLFTSLTLALFGIYCGEGLDFNTQLYPMLSLSSIIAIITGMIQAMRTLPLIYDLAPSANRVVIPAKFFPSNHSRKAPPAVEV